MQLRQSFRGAACLGIAITLACAEEGKWTPEQLLQFPPQWLERQGVELPVSRLWDPARCTGLPAAGIARNREAELPCKTRRVTVPHKFTDVTKEIEASVPPRTKAIEPDGILKELGL